MPANASSFWSGRAADVRAACVATLVCALAVGGCAGLRGTDLAPSGLPRDQDALRRLLVAGQADSALSRLTDSDPVEGDPLLRHLQAAVAAVHSGDGMAAAALFEAADPLLEERLTPSLSGHALSFVASDRSLPWTPSPTERLLIPYYAARARLAAGDLEGAAVEARRLSARLERAAAEDDAPRAGLAGALRLFAGSVFEAAHERNDALVSYRHAALLLPGLALDTLPSTDSMAELVVLVEQGFVAHRVPQSLNLVLAPWEGRRLRAGEASAMSGVTARVLAAASSPWAPRAGTELNIPPPTSCDDCDAERRRDRDHDDDDDPYLLRVAWPALRRTAAPGMRVPAAITTDAGDPCPVFALADVTDGVAADFNAARAGILARAVLRAAAKYALVRTAQSEVSEKDETAGRIVGFVANAGTALLEQADTRSWHLLPDRIVIARVRLPPGEHRLRLAFSDGSTADLGLLHLGPGVTFHSARVW